MTEHGTGYTPGMYAVGDIQLNYTYVGTTFPEGLFATFNLNMGSLPPSTKATTHFVSRDVRSDGHRLREHDSLGQLAASGVEPGVDRLGAGNHQHPELRGGRSAAQSPTGMFLSGTSSWDAGSELKTSTNVKVRITLVHPTACLKVYDFITDADLKNTITSTEVGVNKNNGKVTSTNPYGSLSYNLMVVNTCGMPETFDANVKHSPLPSRRNRTTIKMPAMPFSRSPRRERLIRRCSPSDPSDSDTARSGSLSPERLGAGRLDVPRNGSHEHQ